MSTITFLAGIQASGTFTFNHQRDRAARKVEICKEETAERPYKLALAYIGLGRTGRTEWKIQINDQTLLYPNKGELVYCGSTKFYIQSSGPVSVQIEETDDNATGKLWVDMSQSPYKVSRTPIELDEKIRN
ncbi:MAG: hypothetical protein H7A37_07680 [Chlamydiales bacterium]|nr:hypothetical protein [Chlamydiia bacterium]MCP5508165.1 hypothetical protein [Chlamydiales bacterium]